MILIVMPMEMQEALVSQILPLFPLLPVRFIGLLERQSVERNEQLAYRLRNESNLLVDHMEQSIVPTRAVSNVDESLYIVKLHYS